MLVNLRWYDWLVVNSSAGKDSQVTLDVLAQQADAQGVKHKVVVVHCDLGRAEWEGAKELAELQAAIYGVRFEVVKRKQGDLLEHVRARGMWPSPTARYCTSDHKRGQVDQLFTRLSKETRESGVRRPVRILNCLGLRAEESPARQKKLPFRLDRRASNGKRTVHTFLPIHDLTTEQVWERIRQSMVPHHPAYDLGLPRLGCVLCIMAPKNALLLAGKHNRKLLDEYVAVEKEIGHRFRKELSLAEVRDELDAGVEPGSVQSWSM